MAAQIFSVAIFSVAIVEAFIVRAATRKEPPLFELVREFSLKGIGHEGNLSAYRSLLDGSLLAIKAC